MASLYRVPRAWLDIGGGQMPVTSATWTRKGIRAADTFSVTLPIGTARQFGFDYPQLADFQPEDAMLYAAAMPGGGDNQLVMTGHVDTPEIDFDAQTVTLTGRDKSASLTTNRRSQKFLNQSSTDIVSTIAQSRGLGVSFVGVQGMAGKVFGDFVHLTLNRSDYQIVNDFAEREGFRWYVDGSTLYFEPKGQQGGSYAFTYRPPITGQSYGVGDCWGLKASRNKTAAAPTTVTVKSWNRKDKKLYTATKSMGGIGSDVVAEYHHNEKNQAQVESLAQSRLDNHVRHDCKASWTAPGDLNLDVHEKASLSGTGTIYDQTYDIDDVTFSMAHSDEVFTMALNCKTAVAGRS